MNWAVIAAIAAGMTLILGATILTQLQRRLAGVDRKLDALLRHFHVAATGLGLSDQVKDMARDPAKKSEAIKAHQEETGADLAEATQAVEEFIKSKVG